MSVPLLIFDFDGTIADSVGHIVATMQNVFHSNGVPIPTSELVKRQMGLSIDDTVGNILPPEYSQLANTLARQYEREYRESQRTHKTYLFDGMLDLLTLLAKNNTLAIATGKTRAGLESVLSNMPELARLFASTHTASDGPGKPHPAMIDAAIKQNGADAAHTLMVGDAMFDMLMAYNAGVYCIGVTWGTTDGEMLIKSGANVAVTNMEELEREILRVIPEMP